MNRHHNFDEKLPLRQRLKPIYILSTIIAVLMAAATLAGLLCRNKVYPTDELIQSFLPTDVSVLFIALPMMLIAMQLTRRGRLTGLLLWPGALFFPLYIYLTYIQAMPLNALFFLHLALVALSAYTLTALLSAVDAEAVQQRLSGAVPERLCGGILAGLGFIFLIRAVTVMVTALSNQAPMAETDFALNISDSLTAPAWIICGVLLWRRKALGYVTGLGMLFQGSMLFIGLIAIMVLQPFLADTAIAWVDVLIVLAMGLICFVPFFLFTRSAASTNG